jgi:hypothetical protein
LHMWHYWLGLWDVDSLKNDFNGKKCPSSFSFPLQIRFESFRPVLIPCAASFLTIFVPCARVFTFLISIFDLGFIAPITLYLPKVGSSFSSVRHRSCFMNLGRLWCSFKIFLHHWTWQFPFHSSNFSFNLL